MGGISFDGGFQKGSCDKGTLPPCPSLWETLIQYLPHCGVYHPCKRSKIRLVFDGSAKFQGTLLNKEVLPGPNLSSQLIGVLTRFRTEEVAFMTNIEAMFHQVHIPKKERSSLWYLQWGDVNLQNLIDYNLIDYIWNWQLLFYL